MGGLIGVIQDHHRNKELRKLRELKEEESKREDSELKFCPHCGKPLK